MEGGKETEGRNKLAAVNEKKHLPADAVLSQCWSKCNFCNEDHFNEIVRNLSNSFTDWNIFEKFYLKISHSN